MTAPRSGPQANRLADEDRAVHEWYRFVLSFPPHLVRDWLDRFELGAGACVLDPFCGTGTTLVEARKLGLGCLGIEANPVAAFASATKVDWTPEPGGLVGHAEQVAAAVDIAGELRTLEPDAARLLVSHSISPKPLHKVLTLLAALEAAADERYRRHELLTLARVAVEHASNLRFGPEVSVGKTKDDAPVLEPWLAAIRQMADDLRLLQRPHLPPATVHGADARDVAALLEPNSVDAVITSPPYPNEKDYTRATRLELVLLGFARDRRELRQLKHGLVRSNTRNVYTGDDDDRFVADHPHIRRLADEIERRRVAMGKTSGFERLYARTTQLYFGGMVRHLASLRPALRPGARLAYVVGDQASFLQVMIRTGEILADLALGLGYEVEGIDLFRTRAATATHDQLREEVVVLRRP